MSTVTIMRDGELVEVEAWQEELAPDPEPTPLSLHQIAAGQLQVVDWDITGLERADGVAGAVMMDTDLMAVFLVEEQPDDTYIVLPSDGVTKYPSYFEVTRPNLTAVSFIAQRVQ